MWGFEIPAAPVRTILWIHDLIWLVLFSLCGMFVSVLLSLSSFMQRVFFFFRFYHNYYYYSQIHLKDNFFPFLKFCCSTKHLSFDMHQLQQQYFVNLPKFCFCTCLCTYQVCVKSVPKKVCSKFISCHVLGLFYFKP